MPRHLPRPAGLLALALASIACGPSGPAQRARPEPVLLGSAVLVPQNPASPSPAAPRVESIYFLDDRPVPAEEARTYTGERVARMVMTRRPEGGNVTRIYSRPPPDPATAVPEPEGAVRFRPDEAPPLYATADAQTGEVRMTTRPNFSGLLVVDGVVFGRAELLALRPDDIHSVEVIRGSEAVRVYTDPRARDGVISITTVAASR